MANVLGGSSIDRKVMLQTDLELGGQEGDVSGLEIGQSLCSNRVGPLLDSRF